MNKSSRITIVGAGITGCSIASELLQRGCQDVTILDKDYVASGPTGFSSGVIRQFYTHPIPAQMALQGRDYYADVSRSAGDESGFVECGWLLVVSDQTRALAETGLKIQETVGVHSRWLSTSDVQALVPGLRTEGIVGAVYEPTAGYADPPGAAVAMLRKARSLGAQYLPQTTVTKLIRRGDSVVGVATLDGPIRSSVVIVAAGPWTAPLVARLGHELPIVASRHTVVALRETSRPDRPVLSDPVNMVYLRPEGTSLTLVGSNDPHDSHDAADPDSYSRVGEPAKVERTMQRAVGRLPDLGDAGIESSWSGIYDVSTDGFPILGPLPGLSGIFVAAGMSGHGFKLAPAIGEIMARAVLDKVPDPRMRLFRPERFAESDPVRSVTTSSLTSMTRHR